MAPIPNPDGSDEDRGVLKSLLSVLAFDNLSRGGCGGGGSTSLRRGSNNMNKYKCSTSEGRKPRRHDCFRRSRGQEDGTVDENESATDNLDLDALDHHRHNDHQQQHHGNQEQFMDVDPSFVDIFYDSRDRKTEEALMDEDRIPIGLEPDDSVMLESFEACIRGDGAGSQRSCHNSTIHNYQVPSECPEEELQSVAASCSTLSISDAPSSQPSRSNKEEELPIRFLRAGKGDEVEGRRRYRETLEWRRKNGIDHNLHDSWPMFEFVKNHYPHFFHGKGRNGQPVFYEQPPKTDLKGLRSGGVGLEGLLKHYAMITEFQWQYVEQDDFQRSIYIVDLAGIKISDFVGECVDFVRQASAFTALHYPERAGHVFVVNVPAWFKIIWNVVRPMIDEVTLEKIHILRGKEEIFEALLRQISIENIPQEYGGQSCFKLGEAPEEILLHDLMQHNNELAQGKPCRYVEAGEDACKFCNFTYVRNY